MRCLTSTAISEARAVGSSTTPSGTVPTCASELRSPGLLRHSLFHSSRFSCNLRRSMEISEFSPYLFSGAFAVIGDYAVNLRS